MYSSGRTKFFKQQQVFNWNVFALKNILVVSCLLLVKNLVWQKNQQKLLSSLQPTIKYFSGMETDAVFIIYELEVQV